MKVGVIVGRFQAQRLTDGHKELIRRVLSRSDKVIIFVGVYPRTPDFKNPLPYSIRKDMIWEFLLLSNSRPNVEVCPFLDVFNLPLWNDNLTKKVESMTSPDDSVVLYGSRDSFIFKYDGKYETCEIEANGDFSATELRQQIVDDFNKTVVSEEVRKGIIFGVMYASGKIEA